MLENDRMNLLKTGTFAFVLLIGKWSYGDTFSYSNQEVLNSKNGSVSIC